MASLHLENCPTRLSPLIHNYLPHPAFVVSLVAAIGTSIVAVLLVAALGAAGVAVTVSVLFLRPVLNSCATRQCGRREGRAFRSK